MIASSLLLALLALPARAGDCDPQTSAVGVVHDIQDTMGEPPATSSGEVTAQVGTLFENGPDPGALADILRMVADEPGERGYVKLDLSAEGRFGTGVVNGEVGGEGELAFVYTMTDENLHTVEFDLEMALKAGVSIAGIVSLGGKVEVEGDLVKVAFPSTEKAAEWLTEQLEHINQESGGHLWPEGPVEHAGGGEEPLEISDRSVAGGVYVQGDVGKFGFDGEMKLVHETNHYEGKLNGEEIDITAAVDHRIGTATFAFPVGSKQADVSYTYDWSYTTGSPYFYDNGVFVDHHVRIRIPIAEFTHEFGNAPGDVPTKAVQDLVLNTFAAIEKVSPGSALKGLNYGVFSKVTEQIYQEAGKRPSAGTTTYVTVDLDWNSYGEADGTNNLMYFRTYVGGEQDASVNFDVKAVEVGVELSAGKTELVYEQIGSETVSYVNRQFLYQTEERTWDSFKERNRDALEELVQNVATPGTPYYDPAVEQAWKQGGYEAGMSALEQSWRDQEQKTSEARESAAELARLSNQWQWPWSKEGLRNDMAGVIESIGDPELRWYAYDLVDDYGGDPSRIQGLAQGDSSGSRRLQRALGGMQAPGGGG